MSSSGKSNGGDSNNGSDDDTYKNLPCCRLLARSRNGVEVFDIKAPEKAEAEGGGRQFLVRGSTTFQKVLPDGSAAFVHVREHGIVKCDLTSPATKEIKKDEVGPFFKESSAVQIMDVSPTGNYAVTYQRYNETSCPDNLRVWSTGSGKLVASFQQKKALKRESWPYLHFSHDEKFAFLLSTNEVRVYRPASAFRNNDDDDDNRNDGGEVRYDDKIRIAGVTSIRFPPTYNPKLSTASTDGYLFTSFCPGTKDKPARASLHEYREGGGKKDTAIISKSLFQAEEMKVQWSPVGDNALITLQSSVDATGQSYYGSSHLFMLSKQHAVKKGEVISVPLPQGDGPVLDVQWMPNPDKPPCFVVISGKIPPMVSLHHGQTAEPSFLFGNLNRNVVSWSHHGRFLCLAGFGNLAGNVSFWDKNKSKEIPRPSGNNANELRIDTPAIEYEWTPDSRHFVVATTSPRMNVENGVRVFKYNGEEIPPPRLPWDNRGYYDPDKLLQLSVVPAKTRDFYPDRPQSPLPERPDGAGAAASNNEGAAPSKATSSRPASASTATAAAASSKSSSGAGKYVPPSARGRSGGSSLAERLRQEKQGSIQGAGRVTAGGKSLVARAGGGRTVVGAGPPPGAAPGGGKSKSALKREKARLKQQQQKKEEEEERKKKEEEEKQEKQQQKRAGGSNADAATATGAADPEKRARKLKKTLKQIEDLKQRNAADLNDDQKAKIASEDDLRKELQQLGL